MIVYYCRTCANRGVSDKDGAICLRCTWPAGWEFPTGFAETLIKVI